MIVIWIAATFDHFLINSEFKLTKKDIYTITIYESCIDACAYILGYIYFTNIGLVQTLIRSFALGLVGIFTLAGFLYMYHGKEEYCIGLFIITSKIGISAAYVNCFISIVYMFKTRL